MEHAIGLATEVLDGGAPGLHLYTFNQHQAVLSVLDGVGLTTRTTPSTARANIKESV